MNQLCRVCGESAAGFHFGAFTCEGCKSFFGRTYNNLSSIQECKNNGQCVINKKNRTACKACRLRKCLLVGMSKSGSRYGRRSNWFKIHCLLQQQVNMDTSFKGMYAPECRSPSPPSASREDVDRTKSPDSILSAESGQSSFAPHPPVSPLSSMTSLPPVYAQGFFQTLPGVFNPLIPQHHHLHQQHGLLFSPMLTPFSGITDRWLYSPAPEEQDTPIDLSVKKYNHDPKRLKIHIDDEDLKNENRIDISPPISLKNHFAPDRRETASPLDLTRRLPTELPTNRVTLNNYM